MESNFQEKDNIIRNKSFDFSIRIINLYKVLYNERNEKTLSKQLLRSGTSIGANIEEGIASFSKKEFIYKQISYKEAYESFYWIKLLHKTGFINDTEFNSIKINIEEIIKLLTTILKTSKQNP
ncbi:four helix bundle protein [Chryseobacterium balustinum]|uniref:Four helix bundle protein n=1 Tax=Chryseobacterium balustinum TaxID=246 RepID=A0AAX2IFI5_9FLAO|nr:four helix bundle protein [Chryseobacterium balustinum]AZB31788.1 four helix bundle protein [Chryseobacterium balustinum]SKC05807.1 four helix bundle protein [Chryseobacterium balustinum]SQA86825.1 four helix bundle protein [Chryseobacterium balustinum]